MPTPDESLKHGHRARLRKKFLQNQLAPYELLELVLCGVIPRRDVRPLSRTLMTRFGTISRMLSASIEDLMDVPGVGEGVAIAIKAINQIMLYGYQGMITETPIYRDDDRLFDYARYLLSGKHNEEFHILYLDNKHRFIKDELHSVGNATWSSVNTPAIVRQALNTGAKNIVIIHNHPAGEDKFSDDDKHITRELLLALSSVEIVLHDHILVAGDIAVSGKKCNIF